MPHTLGFIGSIGPWEIIVLLGLGLLIFGKRLPEVGKSLGKGIVEFKKGLAGIEDDIDKASHSGQPDASSNTQPPPLSDQTSAPQPMDSKAPSVPVSDNSTPPSA